MGRNKPRKHKIISGRHIFAVLIAVFALVGGYAAYRIITTEVEYDSAQREYARLRLFAPAQASEPDTDNNGNNPGEAPEDFEVLPDLTEINPDYIAWIRIDGTDIDYPVVQGEDNEKYLNTTFTGERNPSGTIFMDADCQNGFDFFTILHGHNMRDGTMFAGLHSFIDNRFRADYSEIIIYKPDSSPMLYKIFAVKLTNIHDEVFNLPLLTMDDKARYFAEYGFTLRDLRDSVDILVLATCTDGQRNERLLVLAARVRN